MCRFLVLKMPDVAKVFFLQIVASDSGIGVVLLQEEEEVEGVKKPIEYASKKLKRTEVSYATIKKECLVKVWAIVRFARYLYG